MADKSTLEKIHGEPLQDLVSSRSAGRLSILVEPDIPVPTLELPPKSRTTRPGRRRSSTTSRKSDPAAEKLTIDKVRELLRGVLDDEPRWIGAGRTFVVTVDAAQLEEIAESPLVRAIWPNQRRS